MENEIKQVVVGIISKEGDGDMTKYLLVKAKTNFGEFTGCWYPPGGHMEKGESEEEALVREMKEELGLEVVPTRKIAKSPGDVENLVAHWWKCEATSLEIKVDEVEIAEVGWFTKKDMESIRLWPATRKLFNEYI